MQGRRRRQAGLGIPRTHRDVTARWQDRRPALHGPNWEHIDSSAVVGKAVGNAPGATANDNPWLKLTVTSGRGTGILSGVTTVQRINTVGGKLEGTCDKPATYRNVPYSADYVFLRKS
jgi:hypothetical protein